MESTHPKSTTPRSRPYVGAGTHFTFGYSAPSSTALLFGRLGTSQPFSHCESKEEDPSWSVPMSPLFDWFTQGFCRPYSLTNPNHDKPDPLYFEMFPHKLPGTDPTLSIESFISSQQIAKEHLRFQLRNQSNMFSLDANGNVINSSGNTGAVHSHKHGKDKQTVDGNSNTLFDSLGTALDIDIISFPAGNDGAQSAATTPNYGAMQTPTFASSAGNSKERKQKNKNSSAGIFFHLS